VAPLALAELGSAEEQESPCPCPCPSAQLLRALLLRSLWGNRADLSLSAGKVVASASSTDSELLLADDTEAAVALLLQAVAARPPSSPSSPPLIALVLDNCGLELLSDLALVDALLRCGAHVLLHAKRWPTFVSDATPADVEAHLQWLQASAGQLEGAEALAGRLRRALQAGALSVAAHPFWNCAAAGWEMPQELTLQLAGCSLAIFKGDANYRRLLGDRHWPHAEPFQHVVGSWAPCPLLALRTCKAGLVVGLQGSRAAQAAAAARPEDWLTSGVYAVAQLALPERAL
jgi:hypothetical protein